jgi:hypothetical protein
VIKFQSKDFAKILEDEAIRKQIYLKICEATILQYKSTTGEVEITTDVSYESD